MSSVTQRIAEIKQPRGGYIPPKSFNVFQYDDGVTLSETENIHPSLVGLCVDYLTRYIMFGNITESFRISLCGAIVLDENEHTEHYSQKAKLLLDAIVGLDDNSITSACQLCGFDVAFRAGVKGYKPVENILPDKSTIENIRAMVIRSKHFFDDYGPIVLDGFTFQGGYTQIVNRGDGDYLTKDTLWDFKVSKEELKSKYTLQIFMYYLLGIHSVHPEFQKIKKIGIYNPRMNKVYTLNVSDIPDSVKREVEDEVIGYNPGRTIESESKKMDSGCAEVKILKLRDLAERYGVSTSKVSNSFIPLGLPYTMKGGAYQFRYDELIKWEAEQKCVPYGKNRMIVLPTYEIVLERMNNDLLIAKKNKDKERVKELKKEIEEYSLVKSSDDTVLICIGSIIVLVLLLWIVYLVITR